VSGLEELLQHCTVKLSLPGQGGWGTGFFVAPGLILTCAHVVKGGKTIQVRWQSHTLTATVEKACPDPYDITLLRLKLATEINSPCVLLDHEIRSRDLLYLFGYPDEGDREGEPRTFRCDGVTGSEVAAILFNLGQVRPGMSGSPLLNQRTGKVCGMVKFTRDRASDLGGGAVQAGVILEQLPELQELQQSFHGGDRRWSELLRRQPDIPVQPYLEAVIDHYSKQRDWHTSRNCYTPTDAILPLSVQTVKCRERQDGRDEPQPEKKVEKFPVLGGLRKCALGEEREHVLLAGRPGSGKSTALQQLAVALAEEGLVPILVQLKGNRPVLDLIKAEFRRMKQQVTPEQIDEWLLHDRLILLLDGVNEIPNDNLRRELARFREENLTVPMIFTTRDLSLGGDLGIGKQLEMQPLSQPQMHEFVGKYLPGQGNRLLGQLRDRLRELASTPLLLKMLCDVFQQTGEVPQSKGELFRRFDAEYVQFKGLPAVSDDFRRFRSEILQHLAWVTMQGDAQQPTEFTLTLERSQAEKYIEKWLHGRVSDPAAKAKEWLEDLLEHYLLQIAADSHQIEFHHQLFQEYYAAEALVVRMRDRQPDELDQAQFQQDYLNYLKWTEVIVVALSLIQERNQVLTIVQSAVEVDPMLAARLAGEVKPEFQEQTVSLIAALEVPDWLNFKLLEETRSESAIPGLLQWLEDSDSSVRRIAAYALGNIVKKHKNAISPHLPNLLTLIPTNSGQEAHRVIRAIQENCKYYNYDIYQAYLEAQKRDLSEGHTSDSRSSTVTYNIDQVGIINTGSVIIHGDQIGEQTP
jgi:energy-coupling factor transporter ATP-binding protein EcfA2